MPRVKPPVGFTSLIESDSEPDFDDPTAIQTYPNIGRPMVARTATRGRGGANRVIKPTGRGGRRTSAQTDAQLRQALEEKSTNKARIEKATAKNVGGLATAEPIVEKPKRGRPRASVTSVSEEPSIIVKRRGRPPKKVVEEIPETQNPDAEPMEVDELEEQAGDITEAMIVPEPLPKSTVDDDLDNVSLRRRLGELSQRYSTLEARHKDLRDIAVKEAEQNYERLKKQTEDSTVSANKLIAQLKAELAAQAVLVKQGQETQQQLEVSEANCDRLQTKVTGLNTSLSEARSEIKTLNTKLTAARNAEANMKAPGSALKPTAANKAAANAQAEILQAAQAKEDLYGDLTGLIVRGLKHNGKEDVFDCIQTGRNGSKLYQLTTCGVETI